MTDEGLKAELTIIIGKLTLMTEFCSERTETRVRQAIERLEAALCTIEEEG